MFTYTPSHALDFDTLTIKLIRPLWVEHYSRIFFSIFHDFCINTFISKLILLTALFLFRTPLCWKPFRLTNTAAILNLYFSTPRVYNTSLKSGFSYCNEKHIVSHCMDTYWNWIVVTLCIEQVATVWSFRYVWSELYLVMHNRCC